MKKYTNDEHYDEYATNPEYCGYLLRRKCLYILAGTFLLGNIILIVGLML